MFDDTACSVSDMAGIFQLFFCFLLHSVFIIIIIIIIIIINFAEEYMLILEWKMFSAIKEKEFYNLAWKSEKAESRSRHILRMIKRFNK